MLGNTLYNRGLPAHHDVLRRVLSDSSCLHMIA
jgi:hypothetical protein